MPDNENRVSIGNASDSCWWCGHSFSGLGLIVETVDEALDLHGVCAVKLASKLTETAHDLAEVSLGAVEKRESLDEGEQAAIDSTTLPYMMRMGVDGSPYGPDLIENLRWLTYHVKRLKEGKA